MKQFYLPEITTKDGLVEQGIFYKPVSPGKKAMLWVHGLTGTFYGDTLIFNELLEASKDLGLGFASFNNRGHDFLTGARKVDKATESGFSHVTIGAGVEKFEDCVFDIDAGISFLESQGFSEIILVGHSTGANKVCYYGGFQKDPRLTGIILVSPASDRLGKDIDKQKLAEDLRMMDELIDKGKGDALVVGKTFFPLTPNRFISLYSPNTNEDVFDYGDQNPKLIFFSALTTPTLVVFGDKDEYLDRAPADVQKIFDSRAKMKNYKSVILSGANHGYEGKETEFAQTLVEWAKSI